MDFFKKMNVVALKPIFENNFEPMALYNYNDYLCKEKINFDKLYSGIEVDLRTIYTNDNNYKICDIHKNSKNKFIIFNFVFSNLLKSFKLEESDIYNYNVELLKYEFIKLTDKINWENVSQTMLSIKKTEIKDKIMLKLKKIMEDDLTELNDETMIEVQQNTIMKSDLNANYSYFLNIVQNSKDFTFNKLNLIFENFNALIEDYNTSNEVIMKLNNITTIEDYILEQLENIQMLCFSIYNEVNKLNFRSSYVNK